MDKQEILTALDGAIQEGVVTIEDLQARVDGMRGQTSGAVLQASKAQEVELAEEDPRLKRFADDYAKWALKDKALLTWQQVRERLLANNGHFLSLAEAMHEGGILFGVDKAGNPLVADKGNDPMTLPHCGLNYSDTRQAVCFTKDEKGNNQPTGYELFSPTGGNKSDEMFALEKFTGNPFVASLNQDEYRASWLESGDNPGWPRYVYFNPKYGYANVHYGYPRLRSPGRGVRRLLRVK